MSESYEDIIKQGPMTIMHRSTTGGYPLMKQLDVGFGFTAPMNQEAALRAAAGYQNGRGKRRFSVRKVNGELWCVRTG